MQDQLYTSAIKQARTDLRQAYGDSPLDDIPPEHEWKKSIYAYSDAYSLIVVAHFYGSSVDIGEWNKHSTETASQYSNDEDGSFAWVAMNADDLYQKYPDRWLLVDKARVV